MDLVSDNVRLAVRASLESGEHRLQFICSPQMEPPTFHAIQLACQEINRLLWYGRQVRVVIDRGILTTILISF